MSALRKPKRKITPDEYLTIEEKAPFRSEYFEGETFVMAGGSAEHIQITHNVAALLTAQLRGSCRVFPMEMKVWVEQAETFFYPDVTVVCGEIKFFQKRRDALTNPTLLIEVLSDSTKKYDKNDKFLVYQELDSFKEYLLIDQAKAVIHQYTRKNRRNWNYLTTIGLDSSLKLASVSATLELNDIYDLVEL